MSKDAAPKTASKAFQALVSGATDASQLQEALHDHLEREAATAQSPAAPAPAIPTVNASVDSHGDYSVILYPRGNDRLEIFGSSQEELDRKVAAVMKLYGK